METYMHYLEDEQILTIQEAAFELGISIDHLRDLCDKDIVSHFRTPGGHRRFLHTDIIKHKNSPTLNGNKITNTLFNSSSVFANLKTILEKLDKFEGIVSEVEDGYNPDMMTDYNLEVVNQLLGLIAIQGWMFEATAGVNFYPYSRDTDKDDSFHIQFSLRIPISMLGLPQTTRSITMKNYDGKFNKLSVYKGGHKFSGGIKDKLFEVKIEQLGNSIWITLKYGYSLFDNHLLYLIMALDRLDFIASIHDELWRCKKYPGVKDPTGDWVESKYNRYILRCDDILMGKNPPCCGWSKSGTPKYGW